MSDTASQSSTLPRRQLGRFLREAREALGLTQKVAAEMVELSEPGLQRIEAGRVKKVRIRDVRALCEIYEISPENTQRAVELAEQAKVTSWYHAFGGLFSDSFNMYFGLETSARQLVTYHEHVPGLLQTADYARSLIGAFFRDDSREDIERRVELRMKRQAIVTRKSRPLKLDVLLHESALYRVIGDRRIMAAQLRHLAEISKLTNVTVRIHPFSAGCTWGLLHGPFVILDFGVDARGKPIEPPVVYHEIQMSSDVYLEKPADVRRYHELAAALRASALDEDTTRDLLRRATRSYER
ncbi:helix-turn-helix domain-containing protein [Nocardia otitidiscaviarum]|uniref:helix-turn-helix domain-containing protein n=1 Tax=Nocardia otitidiscaviarum TaxID=1823 RepID=UPI0020CD8EA8|nr:helix-turn-helix transcriptional regulator [Nocardia otitidiscaviarum]MCP9623748.1 helix-turn-helix domain-containing protein [Nocardia otitidiscaviarum]